ncbi:MAG TPA: hypothetical protein VLZ56_05805 [Mycoplana sp.]|nr:hypothetical protein [Mycoplana sp.]
MITHLPRLRTVPVPDRNAGRLADYYAKRGYADGVTRCYPFQWIRKAPKHSRVQRSR